MAGRLDGKMIWSAHFAYWPAEDRKPTAVGTAILMRCRLLKSMGKVTLIVDMTEAEIEFVTGNKLSLPSHQFEFPVP
jgi:hypothetical protein